MDYDEHGGLAPTNEPAGEQVKPELLVLSEKDAKRFWSRVDKTSHPKGCWIWTRGGRHYRGYGIIQINKKHELAHRISYRMHHGPIPEGMWILHRCDTRNCVNPRCLRLGTPAENVADTIAKGRFKNGGDFVFEVPNGGYPQYPPPLDPSLVMSPKERHNYERKIDRSGGPDACHIWTGSTQVRGYGLFGLHGKLRSATQLAIRIYSGPMTGPYALHKCDNPRCVNHRHLWAGTQKENAEDRERKGRGNQPTGDKSGRRLHPERYPKGDMHPYRLNPETVRRGKDHWHAINLTEDQITEIRALEGSMFQWQIGERFGVSETTIWRILRRNDWRSKPVKPSSESVETTAH